MNSDNDGVFNVIVVADGRGEDLSPLSVHTSFVMLPICGRPILDHALESLATISVKDVNILVSGHSSHIRNFVDDGKRWGVNISYSVTRGNTSIVDAVNRAQRFSDNPCLIIDLRYFMVFDMGSAVDKFQAIDISLAQGTNAGKASGLYYVNVNELAVKNSGRRSTEKIEIEFDICRCVNSLSGYFGANMELVRKKTNHVALRGKQISHSVIAGPGSTISEDNVDHGEIFAGVRCRVHDSVICAGTVIMGDNVLVDRHTCISNSLILDNTFIGEYLNIENSIVCRNHLIRIDTGTSVTLLDERLIGSMSNVAFSSQLGSTLGRMFALVLLVMSIPLWVVALVDAVFNNGQKIIRKKRIIGNAKIANQPHKPLNSFVIRSRSRKLRNLPLLLRLVAGDISWFGVSMLEENVVVGRSEPWQFLRDMHPVGLIGPAQIELGYDSSIDEKLMADATYPNSKKITLFFQWIFKQLCKDHVSISLSKTSSR